MTNENLDVTTAEMPEVEEFEDVQEPEVQEQVSVEELLPDVDADSAAELAKALANLQSTIQKINYHAGTKNRRGTAIALASKQEKKAMFRSDHVVTADSSITPVTEATLLQDDLLEVKAAITAGRILSGTIVGIERANPDSDAAVNLAVVKYGNDTLKVLIPDFVLFEYDIAKFRDKEGQKKVGKRIERMLGAEIEFIPKHLDEKTRTVHGDRLKALAQRTYENYVRVTKDGKPRVTVGMIVQGRITCITKDAITVEALGVESNIRRYSPDGDRRNCLLTWSYIDNCLDEFELGQYINVKVMALEPKTVKKHNPNESYDLMSATLSVKHTTTNPVDKRFDEFQEGGIYQATVTYNVNGSVFVKLKGEVDCLCAAPKYGALPVFGQSRAVTVTQKVIAEDGTKKIFGKFTNLG